MLTRLAFHSRISKLENGQCVIGTETGVLIPLIAFDAVVNIYLTTLFLIPLCSKSARTTERVLTYTNVTHHFRLCRSLFIQEYVTVAAYNETTTSCFANSPRRCRHADKQHRVRDRQ